MEEKDFDEFKNKVFNVVEMFIKEKEVSIKCKIDGIEYRNNKCPRYEGIMYY